MLASILLSETDSVAINRLFASQSTPVHEVLDRPDVATYLSQLTDTTKVPKNVLLFVERHMPKLLLAAQQKPVTVGNGSFSGSSSRSSSGKLPGPANMDGTSQGKVVTKARGSSSAGVRSGTGKANAEDGGSVDTNIESQAGTTQSSSAVNAKAAAGKHREKDSPLVAVATMGTEDTDDEEALALATQQRDDLALRSANATSLLYVYLSSSECGSQAIEQIVPVSLAALAHPGARNPAVSLCVQRLLLAAFDNDFIKTTEAIAMTLDEELVRGTIENLSHSSVVAETLIALFGSALSASFMMAPTTKTELFTAAWIHYKFVDVFCAEMPVAIAQRSRYNYFYFFREVLKRGFSHTAGPVADVLLREEFFAPMLNTIITTCEDDARLPVPAKTSANSSLSPEALAVVSLIVSLLRKSIILPETPEMYGTTTDFIAPLCAIGREKDRLVRLLQHSSTTGAAIVADNTLGLTRLSVCEMFLELALYRISSTDRILVESGFFPAFLQLCATFAEHDSLARLLHKCVTEVFARPALLGETLSDAKDRDVLMKHLINAEESFLRGESGTSPMAAGALFSALFYFSSAEEMRYAAIATFSIDALTTLDAKPYFAKELKGPLSHLLGTFRDHAAVRERVDAMHNPITGDKFEAKGSAQTPPVRHRPIVNHVGDRLRSKLSISSMSDGETGSPTGWGAIPPSPTSFSRAGAFASPVATAPGSAWGSGGGGSLHDGRCDGSARQDSRGSASSSSGGSNSPTAEELAANDTVQIDMDAIEEEVNLLRAAGSPQLQAYPSFRSMQLTFANHAELTSDDATDQQEGVAVVREGEEEALSAAPATNPAEEVEEVVNAEIAAALTTSGSEVAAAPTAVSSLLPPSSLAENSSHGEAAVVKAGDADDPLSPLKSGAMD